MAKHALVCYWCKADVEAVGPRVYSNAFLCPEVEQGRHGVLPGQRKWFWDQMGPIDTPFPWEEDAESGRHALRCAACEQDVWVDRYRIYKNNAICRVSIIGTHYIRRANRAWFWDQGGPIR